MIGELYQQVEDQRRILRQKLNEVQELLHDHHTFDDRRTELLKQERDLWHQYTAVLKLGSRN